MAPAFLFNVHPASGVPIYRQIQDQVRDLCAGGRLAPGDYLPPVRQVAEELQVNPMTVSKAYAFLEHEGLLERVRGVGVRVAERKLRQSAAQRWQEIEPLLRRVAHRARQLDLDPAALAERLSAMCKEDEHG